MISKNVLSIAVIITMTVVFISSSAFVNPLWAKKSTDKTDPSKSTDKTDPSKSTTTTTSTTSTTSSSAENNYKKFQQCLSGAEGTKGFATDQQIKSCYNPIYRPLATTSTTSPIDFSRPHVDATTPSANIS
jgi:hypothetical protein